ncbi:hypothetical protein CN918_26460 [Priestia megaterium]|nr:hypothetical protein CN918_26460 [Priestia megaterium]
MAVLTREHEELLREAIMEECKRNPEFKKKAQNSNLIEALNKCDREEGIKEDALQAVENADVTLTKRGLDLLTEIARKYDHSDYGDFLEDEARRIADSENAVKN